VARVIASETEGIHVPGFYQRMLESDKRVHLMVDPRATVGVDLSPEQLTALQEERKLAEPSGRYAALSAGRPVIVRGSRSIPWVADGSYSYVKVGPDDMCRPGDPADRLAGRT
jgi:hypothetical protein